MPGLCAWLTRRNPAAVDLETGKTAQVENPPAEDPPSAAGNKEKEKEKEGNKKEGNEREEKEKEEKEKEKAAYKSLLELLELAEDKSVTVGYMLRRVVEVGTVSGLTAALACTLALNWINRERQLGLRMWQFVTMAITIFAGLSIIRCITWLLLHPLKSCSLYLHRDLSYFLREMKTSIDVTLWLCSVLFAWYVWFRPRLKHVHGKVSIVVAYQLTRFLIAACLGSALWVCKNALFYWLEADLHYRQLCDRITLTLRQLHVLQILVNSGVWQFLSFVQDGDDDLKKGETQGMKNISTITSTKKGANICMELLHVKRENVPIWILRRLCEEYMHHFEAKPLPGGTTKNEKHKHQFERKPLPVTTEVVQDPEKLMAFVLKLFGEMKMAKKKSEDNVQESDDQRPSRNNINKADSDSDDDEVKVADLEGRYSVAPKHLRLFFEELPKSDAYRSRFSKENDKAQNPEKVNPEPDPRNTRGQKYCCFWVRPQKRSPNEENKSKKEDIIDQRIGRDEFCSWAIHAYRNCWGLQSTLKSSEQIILKLNRMMMAFVLLLTLIIWLLLSEIVDTAQIALLFSPLLAAKFIFSESTKNMFDGLIFALAMHPFNPGDRVIINNMELLVIEINILTTTFHKYQTGEELIYPNSELATTPIINLESIPDQHDEIEFPIDINTPLEYIKNLEVKIQMALDERKDAFKTKVVMKELGLDEIMMIAHFNYVGSYLTSEVKAVYKSEILSTIMRLQKEMKARIEEPPSFRLTKSYIVEITLRKKAKLKHMNEIIKSLEKRCLEEFAKDDGREFQFFLNNVAYDSARIAFYVVKKSSEKTSLQKEQKEPNSVENTEKLQQELISIDDLVRIFPGIRNQNDKDGAVSLDGGEDNAQKERSIIFPRVDKFELIEPKVGTADLRVDVESKKGTIKRFFSEQHCQYELQVKVKSKKLEIHAWRPFLCNIEEGKQQTDVKEMEKLKQNLMKIEQIEKIEQLETVEELYSFFKKQEGTSETTAPSASNN